MARLDCNVGESLDTNIIADVTPTAFETTAKLAASEKPLAVGTVLVASSADGQFSPASKAIEATDVVLILAEPIKKAEADDEVAAYKTGHFFGNRLVTDGEYELAAADFDAMRRQGFVFKDILEAVRSEAV